jgi:hypothetical protein
MSSYVVRDIASTFSGDIKIGANGDIELANSYDTHKSAVNFLLRTDKGQYKPDVRIGCNLGSFVGDSMLSETFGQMEHTALDNITKFVYSPTDVQVHVIPIDIETAGVFVALNGTYLDSDGNILTGNTSEVLTYAYPYFEGHPTLINIQ